MCCFCKVWECVCFCKVLMCVCVRFVKSVFVYELILKSVGVSICGLSKFCVRAGFVMSGCVYEWIL